MSHVLVINQQKQPQPPVHPAQARRLLSCGQAQAPIAAISLERVRFDTHLMQNAEISGVAYQQGALAGYEVREYLLEKWGRTCAYCSATTLPLQIEHITPRSRGGSDRVSNLTVACKACNTKKGTHTAAEFGHPQIQVRAKQPLKDAAAVNTTRWALYERMQASGLPVEVGTGGRTKYNRGRLGLPTTHWLDAACVGASTPATLYVRGVQPLLVRAMATGHARCVGWTGTGFRGLAPRRRGSSRAFARAIWCALWFPTVRKSARMLDGLRYGRVGVLTSPRTRQPRKVSRFAFAACCTTATALPITQGAAGTRTPDGGGFLPYFQ